MTGRRARGLAAVALVLAAPTLAASELRALVVAGLGGEPEFETTFQRQARDLADRIGELAAEVTLLVGETVSRQRLHTEIQRLAVRTLPEDSTVVVLIGHGSYDRRDYRFNVPGPDVTGGELADWLRSLVARRQLVVVATSASGALQTLLAQDGRTLVTSTRSGTEQNAGVFGRHFTAALAEEAADTDKDGHVSATEAFAYAKAAVEEHYQSQDQMTTEHPTWSGPEPLLALARLDGGAALVPPTAGARQRLTELQAEIAALRADKANREPDAYYAELQRLLLELAVLRREEGWEGGP